MFSIWYNRLFRQIWAGFTGGLCLLVVGCWSGWTSPWIHQVKTGKTPFNFSSSELSWIVALTDIGTVISPIPGGYLMDIIGRKSTYFVIAIIYITTWVLAMFANGATLIYIARFLAGIAEGMSFTVCPMYLGEIAETKIRGAISGFFSVMALVAVLLQFIIGSAMSYMEVYYISVSIAILFLLSIFTMPESPYYLIMKNKRKDAYNSLCWLRYPKYVNEPGYKNEIIIEELDIIENQVKKEMSKRSKWIDLIKLKGNRRATFIVMLCHMFQRFAGVTAMVHYASVVLPIRDNAFRADVLFVAILLGASTFSMFIVDSIGRRPSLIFSSLFSSLLQATVAIYFYVDHNKLYDVSDLRWIPSAAILLFAVIYEFGIGLAPHTLLGEMFPTNMKSKAAALASITFAICSFIMNKMFLFITEQFGMEYNFLFYALSTFIETIFAMLFVIETKQKTFTEIQDLLNK